MQGEEWIFQNFPTKLQKFSNLRELSKCHKSANFLKFKKTKKNYPQGMVWRRRMQNLNPFGQQEIYETKLQKFSNLRELLKCPKSANFLKLKKKCPQGMVWRRRMQNLNSFGELEIHETKLQNFSYLRELSKCHKSANFSKLKKNCPQGMVWRRRMQNLKSFGQLEIYETKLQIFF